MPLCEFCSRLPIERSLVADGILRLDLADKRTKLQHVVDNRNRCAMCSLLHQAISQRSPRILQANLATCDVEFKESGPLDTGFSFEVNTRTESHTFLFNQIQDDAAGRLRDYSSTRNIPEVSRRRLEVCREHHKHCQYFWSPESFSGLRLRLIDVKRWCLVEAEALSPSEDCRYAALSYVWGEPPHVTMTAANLPQFLQEDQLRGAGLPSTIKDAIRLTEAMEIPYLWVDALCIIQEGDEGADKARQIPKMDAVYGLAELTIVQASGQDSKCPLLGFGDDTAPPSQVQGELSPGLRVGLRLTGFNNAQKASSTWITRAWTFQEAVLSSRLLIFHNGHVTWECREAVWCEDMSTEPDTSPERGQYVVKPGVSIPLTKNAKFNFKPQFGSQMLPVEASQLQENHKMLQSLPHVEFGGRHDHISRYEAAVQEYTSREMRYWSDKLNAFAGLGVVHERQMGTQLVSGLPANQLDTALLWSAARTSSLERLPEFPSWSWAGWKGAVRYLTQNPVSISPKCHFWVVDRDARGSTDDGKILLKRLVQAWEADDYVPHDRPFQVRPIRQGDRALYPKVGLAGSLDRSKTQHLDPKVDLSQCLCFDTYHSDASHFSIKDGGRLVLNESGKTVGGVVLDEPLDADGLTADMELVMLTLCTSGRRLERPGEDYFPEFLFPNPAVNNVMVIGGKASRATEPHMEWTRVLLVKKKADGTVERKGVGDMTCAAMNAAGMKQKMCFLS